jgi:hypothetical protein
VRGFRSIGDQEVELRSLTLVYGPNGLGKFSWCSLREATLFYALLAPKNLSLIRSRFLLKTVRVELRFLRVLLDLPPLTMAKGGCHGTRP